MTVEARLAPARPFVARWETSSEIDSPGGGVAANVMHTVHALTFMCEAGHRYLANVSTAAFLHGNIPSEHILGYDAATISKKAARAGRGGDDWLMAMPLSLSGTFVTPTAKQIEVIWIFTPTAVWKDWIAARTTTTFTIVDLGVA